MARTIKNQVEVIHFERDRGDTDPIKFQLKNSKTKEPLDITSDTFTLTVSIEPDPTGTDYIFQSTGEITDGYKGRFQFPISLSDSDNVGTLHYDVQRTYNTYDKTIIKGTIIFDQDLTK